MRAHFRSSKPRAASNSGTSATVLHRCLEKTSKKEYINERVLVVEGKTSAEAVGTDVPNSKGGKSRYNAADLKYDIERGFLRTGAAAAAPKSQAAMASSAANPVEPLIAADVHNDLCTRCGLGGDVLCCDFCTLVYHFAH